jgi:hypothetical protein
MAFINSNFGFRLTSLTSLLAATVLSACNPKQVTPPTIPPLDTPDAGQTTPPPTPHYELAEVLSAGVPAQLEMITTGATSRLTGMSVSGRSWASLDRENLCAANELESDSCYQGEAPKPHQTVFTGSAVYASSPKNPSGLLLNRVTARISSQPLASLNFNQTSGVTNWGFFYGSLLTTADPNADVSALDSVGFYWKFAGVLDQDKGTLCISNLRGAAKTIDGDVEPTTPLFPLVAYNAADGLLSADLSQNNEDLLLLNQSLSTPNCFDLSQKDPETKAFLPVPPVTVIDGDVADLGGSNHLKLEMHLVRGQK